MLNFSDYVIYFGGVHEFYKAMALYVLRGEVPPSMSVHEVQTMVANYQLPNLTLAFAVDELTRAISKRL